MQASRDLLNEHYIDLKDRPFFPSLITYMSSGPVVAMVRNSSLFTWYSFKPAGLLTRLISHHASVCVYSGVGRQRCGEDRQSDAG